MARFYKTAGADPLDYMYRINTPLMAKVLEQNDQYITQNLQQATQLGSLASSFPFLQADEERAREITQQYSKQVDDITAAIQADPANWRKQLDPIRNLGRTLQQDYKTGEISKIAGNYGRYKQTSDYIDKQVEQYNKDGKGISADRAKAYKQMFLSNFTKANAKGTAYNPQTGEYNAINVFDPMNNIDIRKSLSDEMDKMKADGTIRITDNITGSGEYFNKETQKWEGITPERILRIATDRLNNPQLMDYLKQDTMAGVITGVFDTDPASPNYGKFINPYSYNKVAPTSAEQAIINSMKKKIDTTRNPSTKEHLQDQLDAYTKQLDQRSQLNWNNKSYLAPILRSITDQYSYQQSTQENDLRANPIWQERFTQANINQRNNDDIRSRERMQQRGFENAEKLQQLKFENDKALKLMDINKKLSKDTPSNKTNTDNAIVGTLYTSPFYWMSEDKEKMTINLNDEISLNRNSVKQLETALADLQKISPDNKIMIANAENQLSSAKTKLSSLESQRENAINYAINEWKAKGNQPSKSMLQKAFGATNPISYTELNERLVRDFLSGKAKTDYDTANGELMKVEAASANMDKSSPEYQQFLRNTYYPARNRKAEAENIYTTGQRIFNSEVKGYSDSKLEKAAKETTNRNEVVNTTPVQDNLIIEMINAAPSNYKIMDSEGRETNLSFEHGTATTDPKKFRINGAAVTTGLGDKGVELAVTIDGKNYVITPKDDGNRLNSYLAGEFRKSKDKGVQNIGSILGSPTAGTIADMLTEMRMNTNPQYGNKDAWVYKTIPNPANPQETVKLRARSINTGGGEPKWEFQFETNNPKLITSNAGSGTGYSVGPDGQMKGFVPLPSTKSKDGVYHNLEDILSIFPSDH